MKRCWSRSNLTNRIRKTIKKKLGDDGNSPDARNDQSMFVLTALEKIKETRQSSLKKV